MYAKNVSAGTLVAVAETLGFSTQPETRGKKLIFRLRNHSDKYHVISDKKTFKSKVCYHGVYEFLHELFARNEFAEIEANWFKRVKYNKENYVELADEVGDIVIRQWDQLRVRDRCNCEN